MRPSEPRGTPTPNTGTRRLEVHGSGIPPTSLGTLTVAVVAVAALYFGREVFVPIALAILLSFALGPPVLLLRRWHLGRVPSVIAVVVLAFLIIAGIGIFIGNQFAELAGELPGYQFNISQKVQSLRDTATKQRIIGRISGMLSNLNNEIVKPEEQGGGSAAEPVAAAGNNPPPKPVPVEVHQPNPSPLLLLQQVVVPLLQPFATAGIVVVFVIFFLLQREDLRDRFIRTRRRGRSPPHHRGARRRCQPPQPLPADPDRSQHDLWRTGRVGAVVHRRASSGALGHSRDVVALCALYRPCHRRRASRGRRIRRRSRMGDAALDDGSVPRRRARAPATRSSRGFTATAPVFPVSRSSSLPLSGRCYGDPSGCCCRRR